MPANQTQRILVVDDDEFVRNLVRVILRRAGYEADAAADGGEALEKIAGFEYDLIMLDLMMPRVDGLEVLQRLGGHQTVPPIVVMTAADDSMVERIPRQFVKAVIRKPFDVSELTALVAGAMSN